MRFNKNIDLLDIDKHQDLLLLKTFLNYYLIKYDKIYKEYININNFFRNDIIRIQTIKTYIRYTYYDIERHLIDICFISKYIKHYNSVNFKIKSFIEFITILEKINSKSLNEEDKFFIESKILLRSELLESIKNSNTYKHLYRKIDIIMNNDLFYDIVSELEFSNGLESSIKAVEIFFGTITKKEATIFTLEYYYNAILNIHNTSSILKLKSTLDVKNQEILKIYLHYTIELEKLIKELT